MGANWFLLNVVLAVVYKGHGDRIKQAEEESDAVRARALKKAFALLDVSGAPLWGAQLQIPYQQMPLAWELDLPTPSRSSHLQIRPNPTRTFAPHCTLEQAAASSRSRS